MPVPRSGRPSDGSLYDGDPFASVARAADAEADSVIIEDFFRRTGRDLRTASFQGNEIPSGLIR